MIDRSRTENHMHLSINPLMAPMIHHTQSATRQIGQYDVWYVLPFGPSIARLSSIHGCGLITFLFIIRLSGTPLSSMPAGRD